MLLSINQSMQCQKFQSMKQWEGINIAYLVPQGRLFNPYTLQSDWLDINIVESQETSTGS